MSSEDKPTWWILEDLSPHERALYCAGKDLLVNSISVTSSFCKEMITTSTGAIAIYLGLLKFIHPTYFDKYNPNFAENILICIPAIIFLGSSIFFIRGFVPKKAKYSLNNIIEVQISREGILKDRVYNTNIGLKLFVLAIILSVGVIIFGPFSTV